MLFDEDLPRVLDEMKCLMQSSPEDRVGDWFLYRDYTVLRIYGFTDQPYRLPAFLTPRIFALEFMRQKLLSKDVELMGKRHGAGWVKVCYQVDCYFTIC